MSTIQCRRCGVADAPSLPRAPFRSDLGARILESICASCWADWLQHQTLLINHYGLDPRNPESRAFLYKQVEDVLLGGGEAQSVDPSKQGEIQW